MVVRDDDDQHSATGHLPQLLYGDCGKVLRQAACVVFRESLECSRFLLTQSVRLHIPFNNVCVVAAPHSALEQKFAWPAKMLSRTVQIRHLVTEVATSHCCSVGISQAVSMNDAATADQSL